MSGILIRCLVSAPPPGPTSSKFLKLCCCRAATILSTIFSSFKKCCPRDFFIVYIPCEITDKFGDRSFYKMTFYLEYIYSLLRLGYSGFINFNGKYFLLKRAKENMV